MYQTFKKHLCMLLVFALTLSAFPVFAFAATPTSPEHNFSELPFGIVPAVTTPPAITAFWAQSVEWNGRLSPRRDLIRSDGRLETITCFWRGINFHVELNVPTGAIVNEVNLIPIDRNGNRRPSIAMQPFPPSQQTQWIHRSPTISLQQYLVSGRIEVEVIMTVGGSVDPHSIITELINAPANPAQFRDSLLMPNSIVGPGVTTSAYVLRPNQEPNRGTITPGSGSITLAPDFTLHTGRGSDFWWIEAGPEAVGQTFVFWVHANGVAEVIFATVNETGMFRLGNERGTNHFYFYGAFSGGSVIREVREGRFRFIIDPSGYVYEAVLSNRLEGVTATIFQQGDSRPWDAASYYQQNPQITGSDGHYAWYVPAGTWRVRYEKAGFETAYSVWMPVPPEHLEVHIGLVSRATPTINRISGFPTGIEIAFSRFMCVQSLRAENFTIISNGVAVPGEITFLNRESNFLRYDYLHGSIQANGFPTARVNARDFASIIRFVPQSPLSGTVQVTVNGNVQSYADVAMGASYTRTITIVPEPTSIDAGNLRLDFNESGNITVTVGPTAAVAGRRITAVSSNPYTAQLVQNTVTVGSNGQAVFNIVGGFPGFSTLSFTLEDTSLVTEAAVFVRMPADIRETLGYAPEDIGTATESPIITSSNNYVIVSGHLGTFQVIATGNPEPIFSLNNAPQGVTINPATGLITIAGATDAGMYNFTVIASNDTSSDATQNFSLSVLSAPTVQPTPRPPVTSTPSTPPTPTPSPAPTPSPIPSPTEVDVLVNNGAITVTGSVIDNNVSITLPVRILSTITNTAEDMVSFDLSQVENISTVEIPTSAWRRFVTSELGVELIMPNGGILAFTPDAIHSIGEQANNRTIVITITEVNRSNLTSQQRNELSINLATYKITVYSGNNITELDGYLYVTIPYTGELPVGVWRVDTNGRRVQLPSSFNENTSFVTFTTNILSVFAVGHDAINLTPTAPSIATMTLPPMPTPVLRFTVGSTMFTNRGVQVFLDAAPFIDPDYDRTMVPLRAIVEGLGADVSWDYMTRTAYIVYDDLTIRLTVGVPLPDGMGTAIIINDRTFVPLRYISEVLGAEVRWDSLNSVAYIYQ